MSSMRGCAKGNETVNATANSVVLQIHPKRFAIKGQTELYFMPSSS